MENFRSYDDASAMRNRSYEHAMIARPLIITIKEFEDAQKELADLRKRADEIHESIIMKNNERDERISSEELSILMFPLDNLNRQIKEVEECFENVLQLSKKWS